MGAGKTFLGKRIAAELKLPFYDLDIEIQKRENNSINNVFIKYGEEYFRKIESDILLGWDKVGIISTGGGIIENEINRDFLKRSLNFVVWLDPDWKILEQRIQLSTDRPMINNYPTEKIHELWQRRKRFYQECSDLRIE